MKCIRPVYVNEFQCNGKICGSRCCKGWHITVDDETYSKYKNIVNDSERQCILSHLEESDNKKHLIKMKDNLECPFLDEDYLCKIQKRHGEAYLTKICSSYPRVNYQLGEVLEQSLTLTCPIAARLILLPTAPMDFEEIEIDNVRGIFEWSDKIKIPVEEAIKIQATSISILQNRSLTLNERLLNLCLFLREEEDLELQIKRNFNINEYSRIMIDIFSKLYSMDMNDQKKIELQSIYIKYSDIVLSRLMESYAHIFENYLVNEFFMRCYPYAFEGSLWKNCKIFITSYKAMEFAITVTAVAQNGFVTAEEFLNTINALNEKLDHNRDGMKAIRDFVDNSGKFNDFITLMLN